MITLRNDVISDDNESLVLISLWWCTC